MTRPRRAWLLAVPLLLAALAYARTLHGEFLLDDVRLEQDPMLRSPAAVLRAFPSALVQAGRPVTDLTFALSRAAGGLDPLGWHLVSLALHLLATALAFLLLSRLLRLAGAARPEGTALAAAGLFALHPLQSEAVSYLTQRSEVLASGLYLAALLALLEAERRDRTGTAAGRLAWAGGLAAFALALGAKAIAVTLPAAWLLLAALAPDAEGRQELAGWRRRLLLWAPLALLAALFAGRTLLALRGRSDAGYSVPGVEQGSWLLTQARAVATYLRLLAWPSGQSTDWQLPLSPGLSDGTAVASALLLLVLVAGAAWLWWRGRARDDAGGAAGRMVALGVAWFLLLLAPTSLVPLADPLVEHRLYLASLGIFLAAAVAGERLTARLPVAHRGPAAAALAVAAWLALGLALHARNAVWESREAMAAAEVSRDPGAWRARMNLAYALLRAGEPEAALAAYREALAALGSRHPDVQVKILDGMGVALLGAGRPAEALEALRRALAIAPDDPQSLAKAAVAAWRAGEKEAAAGLADRALARRPGDVDGLQVLGAARLERGDPAGAYEAFLAAVRSDPEDGQQWLNAGVAAARMGRRAEACQAWSRVGQVRATPAVRQAAARALAAGCRQP